MRQMMRAVTKRVNVARAMMIVMRVAGNKEGKGSRAMALATREACNATAARAVAMRVAGK
jgi:hypothetical protein